LSLDDLTTVDSNTPMHTGEERREFQRLRLDTPIPAVFGSAAVWLVEIGILGARIRHAVSLSESRAELRFSSDEDEVMLRSEVVRTFDADRSKFPDGGSISALRFLAAIGDSGDHLRTMLARLVAAALEEHHESSATKIRLRQVDGDRTVRGADAQFVSWRLEEGGWKRRPVILPEQPSNGFTVARGEDADEMQRLCAVYEVSDEEGRRLIRMFAELSVSDALQIPPRHPRS
jgi:hypothetical protein